MKFKVVGMSCKFNIPVRTCAALLLGFLLSGPTAAAEAGRTIRVGFYHFTGYHETGENGERSGYGYEYLQQLRKYTGWNFEYVGSDESWAEMLDLLERGEIDLVTGAARTPEREERFDFSESPLGNASVLMTVKAGCSRYLPGDYRNWDGIRVGCLRNSTKNDSFAAFARRKGFRYVPVWFDDVTRLEAALQEGSQIDALVTGSLRRSRNEWVYEEFDVRPFYAIVKKGNVPLLEEFDRAQERLRMDAPALIGGLHEKYYANRSKDDVFFSAPERALIREMNASGRKLRVLLNPDRPPFSVFRDGKPRGVFKEIADEISRRSGLAFEFVETADRHAYRKAVEGEDIDLIFDFRHDYSAAEKQNCILTDPYFSAVISRVRKRNFSGTPRSVALVRDSDVAASALAQEGFDDMVPFYYDSNPEVIAAVRSGAQDVGMIYTRTAEKVIADDEFSTLDAEVVGGLATPYAIGVKNHCDPRLISILDKTVRSLKKSEIDKLVMTHMTIPGRSRTLTGLLMADPARSFGVLGGILLALLVFAASFWALKRNLWRYGEIVSKLPLRFFVVDATGRLLAGTPENGRGTTAGRRPFRISGPYGGKFQTLMFEKTPEVLKTGKSGTFDFESGERRYTAQGLPLPDKTFPVPAALWIALDTTELQEARETALLHAERFRLTLEAIGDGVLVTDEKGCVTMLNNVAEQLTGWSTRESLGRRHEDIFEIRSYLDDSPVTSPVRKALADGRTVLLANHTDLVARDGGRRHIADSAAPIRDRSGKIIGTILVFRDVTGEYAARDRLRETLTSLEYASELTDSAAFLFDPETRVMTGSKILPKLWGIAENGVAVPMKSWVFRGDRKAMLRAWAELAAGHVEVMTAEYRSDKSGSMRHYRMRASADRSNPRAIRFIGVIQDVTEIVSNIGKIREQQELWEKVINAIPVMFFAKDADHSFRYLLCNRAFAAFIGKTPEEVVGKTDAELFSVPEETESFLEKDRRIMEKAEAESFEEDATDRNGRSRRIRSVKQPFTGPDGRRLLLGTCSDITELNRLIVSEQINSEVLARAVVEVDFDRVLDNLAGALQGRMNCDRVILARCNAEGKLRLHREWLSGETSSLKDLNLGIHYRLWDEHLHILQQNRSLVIPNMEEYLDAAGLSRDENYRPFSLIVVPVFIENSLWGALFASYSTRKHSFSENDERLMRSCANVIVLAEIRNRQKRAIERADFEKQMIFNNIRIPLWLHDGDGELLQVNNAVCKLAGVEAGKLTTAQNREIFCSETTRRPVAEVIETGMPVQREIAFRSREYIVNAEPVFGEDRALLYIVKSAVDITELNALLENRQVVNFCLETLLGQDDMVQAIRSALEAVCRHLGAARSFILEFDTEAKTTNCFVEYVAAGRQAIFDGIGCQAYSAKPNWEERFRRNPDIIIEEMCDVNGEEIGSIWLETIRRHRIRSLYARRLMTGSKIWGYLGLDFEDEPHHFSENDKQFISSVAHFVELMLERRRGQTLILNALKEAQAASKAKSFFLATMSHEIRTPLNAVIGFSELLKGGGLSPEEQLEYLDSINLAGNSLLQLINDVLDLSKLEAEQTVLTPQPTDLMVLAREIQAIFQYKALQKKLSFRLDCPEQPPLLKLDHLRLRQILLNLVGNAVKFTDRGEVILGITFREDAGTGRGTLVIRVQDTGIGITPEAQRKIFEPFVQSDAVRDTHVYKGTGLGLAISRRLAERMNGVISLESAPGRGSCFTVRLDHVETAGDETGEPEKPEEPAAANSDRCRILIVDDVPMNLKVLSAMLRKLNIDSVSAESGSRALEILEKDRNFEFLLTDLWMPGMNGEQLTDAVRATPGLRDMKVVAVTADTEAGTDFSATKFDDILSKPVTLDSLRKMFLRRKHRI